MSLLDENNNSQAFGGVDVPDLVTGLEQLANEILKLAADAKANASATHAAILADLADATAAFKASVDGLPVKLAANDAQIDKEIADAEMVK
jgi:hypothetical protein